MPGNLMFNQVIEKRLSINILIQELVEQNNLIVYLLTIKLDILKLGATGFDILERNFKWHVELSTSLNFFHILSANNGQMAFA